MLALHRSCTSTNPGAEPENEAKRQLVLQLVHNRRLRRPPTLPHMKSWSAFTPHYAEDVTYSLKALYTTSAENTNLLIILRSLHPDEWANLAERYLVNLDRLDWESLGEETTDNRRSAMNIVIRRTCSPLVAAVGWLPSVAARASPRSDCDEGSSRWAARRRPRRDR